MAQVPNRALLEADETLGSRAPWCPRAPAPKDVTLVLFVTIVSQAGLSATGGLAYTWLIVAVLTRVSFYALPIPGEALNLTIAM